MTRIFLSAGAKFNKSDQVLYIIFCCYIGTYYNYTMPGPGLVPGVGGRVEGYTGVGTRLRGKKIEQDGTEYVGVMLGGKDISRVDGEKSRVGESD